MTKAIVGRPTKYIPEIIFPKAEEYFKEVGTGQMTLPTVEGLAEKLGVVSDTIREWTKHHKKFSATIKRLADKQKKQLMNDGMYGGKEVNAAMAIFLLKANHGMKDGHETIVNVSVKPILGGETVVDVSTDNSNKEVIETP